MLEQSQHLGISLESGPVFLPALTNGEHHRHHPTGERPGAQARPQAPHPGRAEGWDTMEWGAEGTGGSGPASYMQIGRKAKGRKDVKQESKKEGKTRGSKKQQGRDA